MTLESLLWLIIGFALTGLIVGAVARLLVPGPTPMGILGTIGAGIAGAFIGGFVGRLLFGAALSPWVYFALAVLGAAAVVYFVSGRGRRGASYDDEVVYDRGYGYADRGVVVDDRPAVRRRRRFF